MTTPEMNSVEDFGAYLLDEDRTSFTFEEAEELATALGFSVATPVIRALKDYGFMMEPRKSETRVRTFHSNNHDRWSAYPSHGGSGWEQIAGFAGQVG